MSETEVSPEVNTNDQICQEFRRLVETAVDSEMAVRTENDLLRLNVVTAEYENLEPESLFAANRVIFRRIVQEPLTNDLYVWTKKYGFVVELHGTAQDTEESQRIKEIDLGSCMRVDGEEEQHISRREDYGYVYMKDLDEVEVLNTALNGLYHAGKLTPVTLTK